MLEKPKELWIGELLSLSAHTGRLAMDSENAQFSRYAERSSATSPGADETAGTTIDGLQSGEFSVPGP
jgi:hypothetical protein